MIYPFTFFTHCIIICFIFNLNLKLNFHVQQQQQQQWKMPIVQFKNKNSTFSINSTHQQQFPFVEEIVQEVNERLKDVNLF